MVSENATPEELALYEQGRDDAIDAVRALLKDCTITVERSRRTPKSGFWCTYDHFIADIEALRRAETS